MELETMIDLTRSMWEELKKYDENQDVLITCKIFFNELKHLYQLTKDSHRFPINMSILEELS